MLHVLTGEVIIVEMRNIIKNVFINDDLILLHVTM